VGNTVAWVNGDFTDDTATAIMSVAKARTLLVLDFSNASCASCWNAPSMTCRRMQRWPEGSQLFFV
jgi:hypothetical protein